MRLHLNMNEVREVREGLFLTDLTRIYGDSGQPIVGGLVYTEYNPRLHPLEARGFLGEAGQFARHGNHAAAAARFQRRKKSLAAATWALAPAALPDWLKDDPEAARALILQSEYCGRLWASWTRAGEPRGLIHFIREVLLTAPQDGFHLGELRADSGTMRFSNGEIRPVYVMDLPHYRAPASVTAWLFQGEDNVGVVLDAGAGSEYTGEARRTVAVLPANKYLLITRDRIGAQVEGKSELRSVGNHIELHQGMMESEAKGVERQVDGELFFERDKDAEYLKPEDEQQCNTYLEDRRRGKKTAGTLLPPGIRANIQSANTAMPELREGLERHWEATFVGMGAEDRVMGQTGGSYAARDRAADDAEGENADDAQMFVCHPLQELMARAVRWSGLDLGNPEYLFVPHVKYLRDEDTLSPQELVQALVMARDNGLITEWSGDDETRLRNRLGWR